MLEDFLRLHDVGDEKILIYAQEWGVLGLCVHELPCSHSQYLYGLQHGVRPCTPVLAPWPSEAAKSEEIENARSFRFRERLSAWRTWSKRARCLLNIGARLNQGKLAKVEDWQALKDLSDSGLGESEEARYMRTIEDGRRELASELDGWISMGQVRPRISWSKRRFSLDAVSSGPNLFGLLALAIAVAITDGISICSACGCDYKPRRRPNPNRREYCDSCRASGRAQRDASRDWYQRRVTRRERWRERKRQQRNQQ
jgi:hypothetical protein